MEIISTIKEIVITLATGAGVVIAYLGLRTWKQELKGKNKYKVAFDLSVAVRDLYEKIDTDVRNPSMPAKLIESGQNLELDEYKRRLNEFYEYKRKFFNKQSRRAEILFGSNMEDLIEKLNKTIAEMRGAYSSIETQLHLKQKEGSPTGFEKKARDAHNLLLGGGNEKNDYTKRLKEAVKDIEKFLEKYLK